MGVFHTKMLKKERADEKREDLAPLGVGHMIIALTIHGTYIFSTSDTNFVTLLSFSSCSKRQVFPSFSTTVVGEILLVPRLPPPRVFLFCITLFVFVSVYLCIWWNHPGA